ncbi:MAG: GC-type dockerin domain-anchored protein [Phycisphaerales bacterium]
MVSIRNMGSVVCTAMMAGLSVGAANGQSIELYDNGPFVTEVGVGFDGADISRAETTVITFSMSNVTNTSGLPSHVLDDFTIPTGAAWRLTRLRIFGTQTQLAGTESLESNFQGGFVKFYSTDPRIDGGAGAIGGDFTTNRLVASSFSNAYRIGRTEAASGHSRPIFKLDIDASFLPPLNAGQYWVEYTTLGDPARAGIPSTFPVTPLPTPNGSQYFNGQYFTAPNQLLEAPFKLVGIARCGLADVASLGGAAIFDGQLTADDIIAFLGAFFGGNLAIADVASLGGGSGADGQLTADDVVAFLGAFFGGCL